LKSFAKGADYDSEFIEEGMLAMPPEANVEELDWQPEAKTPKEPEISELERIRRQLEGLL
jgi:hypothetical protein